MITKHIDIINNSITFIISGYDIITYIKIFNDNKKDDIIDLFIENYFSAMGEKYRLCQVC